MGTELLLIIWIILIGAELFRNYYMIERLKSKPNYLISFIIRGIVAIVHAIFFNPHVPSDWWPVLIFQVSSFYILFDLGLNLLRGEHPLYRGKSSGWLDKMPMVFYLLLKVTCLAGLIWSLTILL